MWATRWQRVGNTLAMRWQHVGNALGTHWQHVGNALAMRGQRVAMRGQRDGFGFAFYFLLKSLKSVGNALATMLTPKKVFLFSIDNGWAIRL